MCNDIFLLVLYRSLLFQIWLDRAFRNEIQQLPITCSRCDWTGSLKFYQVYNINQFFKNQLYFLFCLLDTCRSKASRWSK